MIPTNPLTNEEIESIRGILHGAADYPSLLSNKACRRLLATLDARQQALTDLANLAINNEKLEREFMVSVLSREEDTKTLKLLQNGLCKASGIARGVLGLPRIRDDKEPSYDDDCERRMEKMRRALETIEGIAAGSTTANSLPNIARLAADAMGGDEGGGSEK